MNTLRAAFIPGVMAGVLSVLASWLWMGVIFHPFQQNTPGTWRAEGPRSYLAASLIRLFAAIAIACLFTLVFRFNVASFEPGRLASLRFALCLWMAISLPMVLEWAVFIRLHPLVVLGQLLDWLTTALLACLLTHWWLVR